VLQQLARGDVANQADMGVGCAPGLSPVATSKVECAAVPGIPQLSGHCPGSGHYLKQARELRLYDHQAAVIGRAVAHALYHRLRALQAVLKPHVAPVRIGLVKKRRHGFIGGALPPGGRVADDQHE
jgi:hypothetical protein